MGAVAVVLVGREGADVKLAVPDRQRVRSLHADRTIIAGIVEHCSLAEIGKDHPLASFKNGMIDRDQIVRRA
jgi:hypothetical protein